MHFWQEYYNYNVIYLLYCTTGYVMLMFPVIDTNSDHFLKRMLHRYLNCKSVKNDNIFVIKTKCKQRMEERLKGGEGVGKKERNQYISCTGTNSLCM